MPKNKNAMPEETIWTITAEDTPVTPDKYAKGTDHYDNPWDKKKIIPEAATPGENVNIEKPQHRPSCSTQPNTAADIDA